MMICLNRPRTTALDFEIGLDHYCILKITTQFDLFEAFMFWA